MKIPVLAAQFPISFSIKENLDTILSVLEGSNPGDLVVFPEGCLSGYDIDLSFLEKINQDELRKTLVVLQEEAKKREIFLWVGTCIYEAGDWLNASYGFTPSGETHTYHKINLATHERGMFKAGDSLPIFDLNTPNGIVRIGVQLCREIRYPEQWGWLARNGVQVFLHMNNAIGHAKVQPVWRSHLVSRAAETQRFVVSVNNAAQEQICPTIVVAPSGEVLGEVVTEKLGVLRFELELSQVSDWYLHQCRTDVVKIGLP